MKRSIVAIAAALVLSLSHAPLVAQTAGGGEAHLEVPPEQTREERLDGLFAALADAQTEASADAIEQDILELWLKSGSDTIDLLMLWTLEAIDSEDYARALDFLDRIIAIAPGYVEGWNKRATVHFMNDDLAKSIADIEMTLSIEPRHFGALAGLGTILAELEEFDLALAAYRRALDLDPYMKDVQEAIDRIEKESGGYDL